MNIKTRKDLVYECAGSFDPDTPVISQTDAEIVMDAMETRIKELEEKYKRLLGENQGNFNAMSIAIDGWEKRECELLERIAELEEQCTKYQAELMNNDPALNEIPKWISVKDRLPNEKEQYKLLWVGFVRMDNTIKYVYEASFDYYTKQFYTENDWGDKTFTEPDIWMVVPPPPTTKEK